MTVSVWHILLCGVYQGRRAVVGRQEKQVITHYGPNALDSSTMTTCFIKISGPPNQSGSQVFCPPPPLAGLGDIFIEPLTDEQVFCDKSFYNKFTLPSVRVYVQQFFMTSFSLTSLNVVCRHDDYTKCMIHRWPTYYWVQYTLTSFLY